MRIPLTSEKVNAKVEQWRIHPGFGYGGRQPRRRRRQRKILTNFPQKLHESKENWTLGGACVPGALLDPPLWKKLGGNHYKR